MDTLASIHLSRLWYWNRVVTDFRPFKVSLGWRTKHRLHRLQVRSLLQRGPMCRSPTNPPIRQDFRGHGTGPRHNCIDSQRLTQIWSTTHRQGLVFIKHQKSLKSVLRDNSKTTGSGNLIMWLILFSLKFLHSSYKHFTLLNGSLFYVAHGGLYLTTRLKRDTIVKVEVEITTYRSTLLSQFHFILRLLEIVYKH